MSASPAPANDGEPVAAIVARLASSDARAERRHRAARGDLLRGEDERLDDRTRAAAGALLEAVVTQVEGDVVARARAILGDDGATMEAAGDGTFAMLAAAGLLRDGELADEAIAQARLDLIDAALVANRAPGSAPGLLRRLSDSDDAAIRAAAQGYARAAAGRRVPVGPAVAELDGARYQTLAYRVAAALCRRSGTTEVERALAEAATQAGAAHAPGAASMTLALRLAAAIDGDADALPELLLDALEEGHSRLFVALLAHALGVDSREARALVLAPDGDRLWLALRALGMEREMLGRIGWALGEADRLRDVELLPDAIDAALAVSPAMAGEAVLPLTLAREFRDALGALRRSAARA